MVTTSTLTPQIVFMYLKEAKCPITEMQLNMSQRVYCCSLIVARQLFSYLSLKNRL